jgi:hypothetical protein
MNKYYEPQYFNKISVPCDGVGESLLKTEDLEYRSP